MEGELPVTSGLSLQCSQRIPKQGSSQCKTYYSDCAAALNSQTNAERGQVPSPYTSSSFLCFLTKTDGSSNLIQSNDVWANNVQSCSIGSSSLAVSRRKNEVNEISSRTFRSANVTTSCSDAACKNEETTWESASNAQKTISGMGNSDGNSDLNENGGQNCTKTIQDDPQGHEPELSRERKGKFLQAIENSSDISRNHGQSTEAAEEEDERAFEISQFFEAIKEGNTCLLDRLNNDSESGTDRASGQANELTSGLNKDSESGTDRASGQANELTSGLDASTSNAGTVKDQSKLDRNGSSEVSRDEVSSDSTVLEPLNTAAYPNDSARNGAMYCTRQSYREDVHGGFSGKWYDDVEPGDSVSVTFSGPLPFSGPLSFSGPVSYSGHSGQVLHSGSVSHRSDSSNASTHSFAFPILPYEWNSSPVKMAQPDRRRRHRGWKGRLCSHFCCKKSATVYD